MEVQGLPGSRNSGRVKRRAQTAISGDLHADVHIPRIVNPSEKGAETCSSLSHPPTASPLLFYETYRASGPYIRSRKAVYVQGAKEMRSYGISMFLEQEALWKNDPGLLKLSGQWIQPSAAGSNRCESGKLFSFWPRPHWFA